MPLSDFFKKSPKKEPGQMHRKESVNSSTKDESLLSPELQKKRYNAAMEFIKIFQEKIPLVGGKPHAGTVLSIPARLAGSSLYRSLKYKADITPGVVVLSEEVNDAWPQLLNLFAFYCKQNGLDVMAKPLITKLPEQDKPRMEVDQVLAEYQTQYLEIMKKHGLDYLDGARVGMIVCNILFEYHCKTARDMDPFIATGIVAMGVIEGAKTAPPPLGASPKINDRNKNRLVLGERDAAIQEAIDSGGVYIDLNPEVLRTLKEKHIDPYLIYEQALLRQIKANITRIDFVQANVDELFAEWRSKPEGQAPIYVRLIFWLKDNARSYGYDQTGNSWVLKQ